MWQVIVLECSDIIEILHFNQHLRGKKRKDEKDEKNLVIFLAW